VRTFLERRLTHEYVRFIGLMVLLMFVAVFTISLATSSGGRTVFGPQFGADFTAFYIAGKIFNEYGPDRVVMPNFIVGCTGKRFRMFRETPGFLM
jgi:hypothetical protein